MTWKDILKTKEKTYRTKQYGSKAIPYDGKGMKRGDKQTESEGFGDKYEASFRESLPDFPFKAGKKKPRGRVTRQYPRSAKYYDDGRQIDIHSKSPVYQDRIERERKKSMGE